MWRPGAELNRTRKVVFTLLGSLPGLNYPFARVVYAGGNPAAHGKQIYAGQLLPGLLACSLPSFVLLGHRRPSGFWPGLPAGIGFRASGSRGPVKEPSKPNGFQCKGTNIFCTCKLFPHFFAYSLHIICKVLIFSILQTNLEFFKIGKIPVDASERPKIAINGILLNPLYMCSLYMYYIPRPHA